VAWAVDGGCVLSVSEDQTARLWTEAKWVSSRNSRPAASGAEVPGATGPSTGGATMSVALGAEHGHWCEIARTQVG
jgi:hypothetical protein